MDDFLAEATTLSGTFLGQTELAAGDTLGRYELLVPIGTGGMGSVWAARLNGTRGFRKLVAIKTILRPMVSATSEQMLFQEAVLASQIHHQNVAQTFELAEHEGILYLVMELVPGEPLSFLRKAAPQAGGFPLTVAVNLIGQVCRGLKAAHEICDENGNRIGLVHRDISPPNIMVTPDGTAKIVDFGVATTTTAADVASLKGKFSNLAPEQLRGEPVDARADVFATGILLYSLTVGRHPFREEDDQATVARILATEEATAPSAFVKNYPRALETVVLRALEKDRKKRIQSAAGMLDALIKAVPNAFGPTADAFVAKFVQELMKERLEERRSALRIAEEFAERASQLPPIPTATAHSAPVVERPSQLSLMPTATAQPTPADANTNTRRVSRLGLAALVAGFGVAALIVGSFHLVERDAPVVRLSGAPSGVISRVAPREAPNEPSIAQGAGPMHTFGSHAERATSGQHVVGDNAPHPASSLGQPAASPPTKNGNTGLSQATPAATSQKKAELAPSREETPEPPAASAGPIMANSDPLTIENHDDRLDSLSSVTGATHAVLPPIALAPASPLNVTSKVGHKQLRIDPSADAYRPRIPHALARSGQAWDTRVNICVSTSGTVSKVDVTASASPALDNPISKAISRWRYEPLRVNGEATAFCYALKYEFSGA